jgi:hypothetical protein
MRLPNVYFGAADRQMEYFLDAESFYDSLVSSLLFQGNIVIPDIFFYISEHIADLVTRKSSNYFGTGENEPSDFFIAGLQEGIVIPSFRNKGTESFRENYRSIVEEGIQGLLPEAESIATSLENAAERSSRFDPSYWPEEYLSEGFEERTKEVLLTESATDQSPVLDRIWDNTREMREVCIPEAIEVSNEQGRGLRRGTLYNSIARFLGLEDTTIDDIRDIVVRIEDPARRESVRYLLKWINYCYQVNQGEMFGLSPSLAKLDHVDIPFSEKFYPSRPVSSTTGDDHVEVLRTTLKLPFVKQLFTVPPEELLDLRNG